MPIAYLVAAVVLGAAVLPGAAAVPNAVLLPAAEPGPKKPASATGTLSITGVCVDSNQRPLVGVDVFLLPHPRIRYEVLRATRTAADGRFRFNGVPAPFGIETA